MDLGDDASGNLMSSSPSGTDNYVPYLESNLDLRDYMIGKIKT